MTEEQTLAMYSGHPMGLLHPHKEAGELLLLTEWLFQIIPNRMIGKK
jgi:urocanate hydratase